MSGSLDRSYSWRWPLLWSGFVGMAEPSIFGQNSTGSEIRPFFYGFFVIFLAELWAVSAKTPVLVIFWPKLGVLSTFRLRSRCGNLGTQGWSLFSARATKVARICDLFAEFHFLRISQIRGGFKKSDGRLVTRLWLTRRLLKTRMSLYRQRPLPFSGLISALRAKRRIALRKISQARFFAHFFFKS